MTSIALAFILVAALLALLLIQGRKQMSKTADLTAAVQANMQVIADLATRIGNITANFTPDAEIQPLVDQVVANNAQIDGMAR